MIVPDALLAVLAERFNQTPSAVVPVGSTAARITLGKERCVVKWTARTACEPRRPDPCEAEARGLRALAEAHVIRIPQVFDVVGAVGDCPAFIVIEWIDVQRDANPERSGQALGQALAALHRSTAPAYGLAYDNYCGPTPQDNRQHDSWLDFYRECRLGPQIEQADRSGLLPTARRDMLDRVVARLDRWFALRPEPPSLIHGDLWGGNWLIAGGEQPVLIDPAVSYSHREAELAMCHLFGGFPQTFFAAYDEVWPPLAGRDERVPLLQLYHLLNHLNLFGESYGGAVDRIARRYGTERATV